MKKSETIVQVFCLISVILGIGIGFLLRLTIGLKNKLLKDSMQIPGNILLAILQMFAVPLIVTSVLAGVTGLNTKMSKKIAIVTGAFVSIATILASSYAMILVLSVAPGKGVDVASEEPEVFIPFSMHLVFMDLLRNLFPENFLQAFFEQYKTEIVHVTRDLMIYPSPRNDTQMQLIGTYVPGANILGLIIWSFTIGVLINRVGHTAQSTVKAIQYINDAIKIIVRWFMWYLPIGVLFLIVDSVLAVEDWGEAYKLVKFVGVALVGMSTAIVTFGIAGVPVKGAVGTIMILTAVGLPAKDAVILVIFEWLLDHFTTLVNVLTNIMCLSAVNRLWEKDLQVLEEQTRTDKVRAPSELDLDLSCLEPDDEPVPSATTQSEPVLPQS
ncbi:excitatory amino acid transporter 3-like isoform X2 [Poeciliopsis prolifica]|uniref:excitatory amino acid transporter 3-like isoform X2 n=1 Tax=Poeciliopsis prolifica TaxID=188132 RepID=UPI002413B7FE|nr:excitatory amino acid transporter 3-like isoform X2 [Poeciliopsis prolifica]